MLVTAGSELCVGGRGRKMEGGRGGEGRERERSGEREGARGRAGGKKGEGFKLLSAWVQLPGWRRKWTENVRKVLDSRVLPRNPL